MKTKLSILIALVLAVSLLMVPAAVSADPGALSFQEDGQGVVEWSTENPHSGIYSVRLELPTEIAQVDEARVKFGYYDTLDSLLTISFYGSLEGSIWRLCAVWPDFLPGYYAPYISMSIDRTGDGEADAWLVQTPGTYWSALDTWYGVTFDDASGVRVAGDQMGAEPWPVPDETLLADLKGFIAEDAEGKTWGECEVLEVKVGIGTIDPAAMFAKHEIDEDQVGKPVIAFVDDVTINEDVYELEAPSGFVDMSATYPAPVIGISVSPGSVSFGDVYPGLASDPETVTVTNTGNVVEDFSADIINKFPAGVYTGTPGLTMNLGPVSAWEATVEPAFEGGPAGAVVASLVLTVPEGTPYGTYHATLIFWAEMAD